MTADRPSGASSLLGSPGARWTPEEEEALVAAVRAGAALQAIAESHGRRRGGIESRLRKMIPADADVPKDEQLGWIIGKLADPTFDWRTPLAQSRPARRPSSAARPGSPALAASSPVRCSGSARKSTTVNAECAMPADGPTCHPPETSWHRWPRRATRSGNSWPPRSPRFRTPAAEPPADLTYRSTASRSFTSSAENSAGSNSAASSRPSHSSNSLCCS